MKTPTRLIAMFATLAALAAMACTPPGGTESHRVGSGLPGSATFPTTASVTSVSNGETVGPNIATALNVLAGSVVTDLGTVATGNAAFARAVVTALSGAYTGSGTGVLTASANAAFGTQDSISTLVVGDVVLLPGGLANITAPKDTGPYVITAIGSGAAKWSIARPAWWPTGSQCGATIAVSGESVIYGGSQWFTFAPKGTVVDTTDCQVYPDVIAFSTTLVAGTKSLTTFPIRSTTLSAVNCVYSGVGAQAATVNYKIALTAGYINTGTVAITALAAGMLTGQTTDVSTLNCELIN